MNLPPLKTERLYRQISNLLIQSIKAGTFPVGQALPAERELASQLGVSRSSVREALIALEIAGWVDIKTGHGVFVCDPSIAAHAATASRVEAPIPTDTGVEELLKARELIEGEIAALAAANGNAEQRRALGERVEALKLQSINNEQFLDEDKRFHLLIGEMTGNAVLRDVMEFLWEKRNSPMFLHLEAYFADRDLPVQMNDDHARIAAAVIAGDAIAAKASMQAHLRNVVTRLLVK
jgi:GntR family uxuAB operon transcriptional repressor